MFTLLAQIFFGIAIAKWIYDFIYNRGHKDGYAAGKNAEKKKSKKNIDTDYIEVR